MLLQVKGRTVVVHCKSGVSHVKCSTKQAADNLMFTINEAIADAVFELTSEELSLCNYDRITAKVTNQHKD